MDPHTTVLECAQFADIADKGIDYTLVSQIGKLSAEGFLDIVLAPTSDRLTDRPARRLTD